VVKFSNLTIFGAKFIFLRKFGFCRAKNSFFLAQNLNLASSFIEVLKGILGFLKPTYRLGL
jgi:hypothetical protein